MLGLSVRFHQLGRVPRSLCLAVLGALAGLGQAPFDAWWMTILALTGSLWLVPSAPSPHRAFGATWVFGIAYFGVTLAWIVEPFQVDAQATGWMAPFALVLMAGGAALFWGGAGYVSARLRPGAVSLALMLLTVEVMRSLILTGFPWALLGHIWIDTPLAQLAAWVGPHGLTGVTLVLALGLGAIIRRNVIGVIPIIAAIAGWTTLTLPVPPQVDGPVIRLVQPNAPQDQKWHPDKRQIFLDRMLEFSAAGPRPDLIVWPETAVPRLMGFAQPVFDAMAEAAGGVPLVTGINRNDGDTYHNSLIVLDDQGYVADLYDKAHLVPFGEYIPLGQHLAALGVVPLNVVAGFAPGRDQGLIDVPGIGPARALICYEGIFAEEIVTGERPRLMVLITNDAWFGDGLGPRQHLAQARLRAIEQGLPMVRAANTGISAMIDARGRITGQLGLNEAGYLDAVLPPARPPTPYSRFGDWPVLILLMTLLLGMATSRLRLSD